MNSKINEKCRKNQLTKERTFSMWFWWVFFSLFFVHFFDDKNSKQKCRLHTFDVGWPTFRFCGDFSQFRNCRLRICLRLEFLFFRHTIDGNGLNEIDFPFNGHKLILLAILNAKFYSLETIFTHTKCCTFECKVFNLAKKKIQLQHFSLFPSTESLLCRIEADEKVISSSDLNNFSKMIFILNSSLE